ncbi:MAG: hypothetical protein OXU19_16025 [bacterium]|nr:hypothetical protein [bacterium]
MRVDEGFEHLEPFRVAFLLPWFALAAILGMLIENQIDLLH